MPKRFQIGPLGEHDDEWLVVWSALTGRTKAAQGTQIIAFRVRERKAQIKEMLEHSAQRRNMTPDELFRRIVEDPEWLKKNPIPGDEPPDSTAAEEMPDEDG